MSTLFLRMPKIKIIKTVVTLGLALVFTLLNHSVRSQSNVDHWETVVYDTSIWRYLVPNTSLGADWVQPGFDDSNWQLAKGGFGYGDNDDSTEISTTLAVFIRRRFQISDLAEIESALVHIDYDDGYIAYINGVELSRRNMGAVLFPQYDQPSAGLHEALLYQGQVPEGIFIDNTALNHLLVQGENVIAIQVHNANIDLSDLTARGFLSVGMKTSNVTYGKTPAWFSYFDGFESSNLPIVVINTGGAMIEDDLRIVADMGVIDNGNGLRNNITDPFNNYNGKISIEIRGESSQMFPKKSYGLETQTNLGENNNVPLLGMPSENDWILYAPYSDKSLIRNVLAFKMANDMGRYASRTRFCEVLINDEYLGVYVLMEKIKRDSNRVDIAKLTAVDLSGDELTGGYILRIDKIDDNDYPPWTSTPVPQLPNEGSVRLQYFDPKGDELASEQRQYIKSYILEFESTLSSSAYDNLYTGYSRYIYEQYFVDYIMLNEVAKNVDAYIFSTYLYKDKDSKGGKLKMGPLWDYNLGYGNVNYHANAQFAPGWIYNDDYRMYWFRRLMSDPNFANRFQCRWYELRDDILSNENITFTIDSLAAVLDEAQARNFDRWQILGNYVWPNQFVGSTYLQEIDFLKQWLIDRLVWLDEHLFQPCTPIITGLSDNHEIQIDVFPNPSNDAWQIIGLPAYEDLRIVIYDQTGRELISLEHKGNKFTWFGIDNNDQNVKAGIYFLKIIDRNGQFKTLKLVKTE